MALQHSGDLGFGGVFLFGSWVSAASPSLGLWMQLSLVGIPRLPGGTGSFHAGDDPSKSLK